MVLDGGPCTVGVESTIVSCLGEPALLRPGGVAREEIERVLGRALALPALADDLAHLTQATRDAPVALHRLIERCGVIEGRGACRHPDGVVRFVRSALSVFERDITQHAHGTPCQHTRSARHFASVPTLEREEELIWE